MSQQYGWKKLLTTSALGNPLAQNPLNPNTLYSARDDSGTVGVIVSRDRGESWELLSIVGGGTIKSIIVSPLDTLDMLVGQEGQLIDRILKSTNGGVTWTQTHSGDFSYFGVPVEFNPAHPDTVYTMTGSKFYRSTDFGSTWDLRNSVTGFNAWCDAAVRPDSVDIVYVGDQSSGIWKTTDGGITFRSVHQTSGEIPMIAIDPVTPSVAYATKFGGGGGLLKTTDYGESWVPIPPFDGINTWGVALSPIHPNVVLMGAYEPGKPSFSAFISYDAGSNWIPATCGLEPLTYGALVVDSTTMLLMQGGGMYRLVVYDSTTLPRSSLRGTLTDSIGAVPVTGIVTLNISSCSGALSIVRQTDSTGTFSFDNLLVDSPPFVNSYTLSIDPEVPYAHLNVSSLHVDSAGLELPVRLTKADVFVVGEDSSNYAKWYRETLEMLGVGYNNWNTVSDGPAPFGRGNDFRKKCILFFTGSKHTALDSATLAGLSACADSGISLFLTGQDLLEFNDTAFFFKSDLDVGFGGNSNASYCEGISGELHSGEGFFTSLGDGARNQSSRDVILGLDGRSHTTLRYVSTASSPAAVRVDSVGSRGARAIVAGFGFESISGSDKRERFLAQVIGYLDGSLVVGVDEDYPGVTIPSSFRLEQNYPNPFNPRTSITFHVARTGFIRLAIYDILGREITRLVDEDLPAGTYSRQWFADGLSSGLYVYRIIGPGGSESKSMLLLK